MTALCQVCPKLAGARLPSQSHVHRGATLPSPPMKRVYIASDPIDAELVAGLLMAEGIRAVVFNDHLWPIAGLAMTFDGAPAVWVTDDADEERARNLIAETRNPKKESPPRGSARHASKRMTARLACVGSAAGSRRLCRDRFRGPAGARGTRHLCWVRHRLGTYRALAGGVA